MIINGLLIKAHTDLEDIQWWYQRLLLKGVAAVDLPGPRQLEAIALLSDYARDEVIEKLQHAWASIVDRNLIHESPMHEVSTPLLRLLSYTLNAIDELPTLSERLDNAPVDAVPPSSLLLNVPDFVSHIRWGQRLQLPFKGNGVEALQISADAVFGLQQALIRSSADQLSGEIEFFADDGDIHFTLLAVTGDIFRKTVSVRTIKSLEELG